MRLNCSSTMVHDIQLITKVNRHIFFILFGILQRFDEE